MIVELSKRFAVASQFTSLLVLESAAMFKAFGLDRGSIAPTFTGEVSAHERGGDAEDELEDAKSASASAGFGAVGEKEGVDGREGPRGARSPTSTRAAQRRADGRPRPRPQLDRSDSARPAATMRLPHRSPRPREPFCAPGDPFCVDAPTHRAARRRVRGPRRAGRSSR